MSRDTVEEEVEESETVETRIERAVELEHKMQSAFDRLETHDATIGDPGQAIVESIEPDGEMMDVDEVEGFTPTDVEEVPSSIRIIFRAPDNTRWETTTAFPTSTASLAYELFEYTDADRRYPASLIGAEIPVLYTTDGWKVHLPHLGLDRLYRWQRWMLSRGLLTYREGRHKEKIVATDRTMKISIMVYVLIVVGMIGGILHSGYIPFGLILIPALAPMLHDLLFKWRARGLIDTSPTDPEG